MLTADYRNATHPLRERPDYEIKHRETNPRYRKTLRPLRIFIRYGGFAWALANHLLDISHRRRRRECRFVDIHLIVIFERAQQLDAPERVELQIHLEIRRRVDLSQRFSAYARDRTHDE